MLSRPARVAALATPTLAFLALLAAAEGWLRSGTRVTPLQFLVTDPHQVDGFTDDRAVGIFEGDPLLFWRLAPGLREVIWDFTLISTNAEGLRYPRPVGPRPAGGVRIVTLGDSVTFGYRVPVVWAETPGQYDREARPYPALLEERLGHLNPDVVVEVIPLAVPGYSSHQGRLWLERDVERLQPDLVTACFGWNDIALRAEPDAAAMRGGWRATLRGATVSSQLLMRMALRLRKPGERTGSPVSRTSSEAFAANHVAMERACRLAGARFLALGTVYRDAVTFPEEALRVAGHRRALSGALATAGIPYLEVSELTEAEHPENAGLFGEAIHPNARGHALLAEEILAFLSAHPDLLPHARLPGLAGAPRADDSAPEP
jgi:lysophospholipase L1-like esterase